MTNRHSPTPLPHEKDAFAPILDFVRQARGQALAAVNRELERRLDGGLFERTLIAKPKLSPAVREIHRSLLPAIDQTNRKGEP